MQFGIEKEPETDNSTPVPDPDQFLQCVDGKMRELDPPSREPELKFVVLDETAEPNSELLRLPADAGPENVVFTFREPPPDRFDDDRITTSEAAVLIARALGADPLSTDNGDGTFTHEFRKPDPEWPDVIGDE